MTTPLPWSHSSLQHMQTCPRQYEEVKVLRNYQDQKNAASLWGDRFHKLAEVYIRERCAGRPAELSAEIAAYVDYLEQFVRRPGTTLAERQYALDRGLRPCEFLGPTVWCRGIIDVLTIDGVLAKVDDHKTGKRKKDPQQLMIFALLVFYHHPEVMRCETNYHWLQEGGVKDGETYHRHDVPDMWAALHDKLCAYRDAFHKGVFPPKPSGLCKRHCPVDSCEYFGRGPRG